MNHSDLKLSRDCNGSELAAQRPQSLNDRKDYQLISGKRSYVMSASGRFLPVAIESPQQQLLAVSCHSLSDGVHGRNARESRRSSDVNFIDMKDRNRPLIADHKQEF